MMRQAPDRVTLLLVPTICSHILLCLPGVEEVDYSRYPDRAYQLKWLRRFLEQLFSQEGRQPSEVTDKDVERLYVQVNKFALVGASQPQ